MNERITQPPLHTRAVRWLCLAHVAILAVLALYGAACGFAYALFGVTGWMHDPFAYACTSVLWAAPAGATVMGAFDA